MLVHTVASQMTRVAWQAQRKFRQGFHMLQGQIKLCPGAPLRKKVKNGRGGLRRSASKMMTTTTITKGKLRDWREKVVVATSLLRPPIVLRPSLVVGRSVWRSILAYIPPFFFFGSSHQKAVKLILCLPPTGAAA